MDEKDLRDIYRVFHPMTAGYIFFSVAQGTFSKIDHILGHKASVNKYTILEIILYILAEHNKIKLEITSKDNHKNHSNSWRLNDRLLNDQRVIEEIMKEIKKFPDSNENEDKSYRTYGTK
jgi:hypothetical protein